LDLLNLKEMFTFPGDTCLITKVVSNPLKKNITSRRSLVLLDSDEDIVIVVEAPLAQVVNPTQGATGSSA
jgi:hypothetical protein